MIELELKVKVEKDLGGAAYMTESGNPTRLDKELETEDLENDVIAQIGELLSACGYGYSLNVEKATHSGEIMKEGK